MKSAADRRATAPPLSDSATRRGHVWALPLLAAFCVGCGQKPVSPGEEPAPAPLPQPAAIKPPPEIVELPRHANSIGMEFVELPAGEFEMGAARSDTDANPDERPQHQAVIERPFSMAIHETTVGQFRRFVEATGYRTAAERSEEGGFAFNADTQRLEPRPDANWQNTGFSQDDSHPVVNVNWNDAVAFCDWLSKTEGVAHRLPSEAEWEYGCRARSTTRWFYGESADCLAGAANICDASLRAAYPFAKWATEWNDGHAFTAPVGSFPPNAFGLYDLHGNVFEWCQTTWTGTDYQGHPVKDPTVPDVFDMKVLRGGSYLSLLVFTRSSDRVSLKLVQQNAITGFRVVHD